MLEEKNHKFLNKDDLLDKALGRAIRNLGNKRFWKDLIATVKGWISILFPIGSSIAVFFGIKNSADFIKAHPWLISFIVFLLLLTVSLLFYSFLQVIDSVAIELHKQECATCNTTKQNQELQDELLKAKNQLNSSFYEIQRLLYTLASTAHDVAHRIRNAIDPTKLSFDFQTEIVHVLDMCKRFFQHKYSPETPFTVSLMEVDNLENPQHMVTTYYSNGTLEDRKKWRSVISVGDGEVAGKFLRIQNLKNKEVEPDDEFEPVIWTRNDLSLRSFILAGSTKKVCDSKKTNKIKKDKDYYYGISSPFLVKGYLQGCINVDIPKVRGFKGFSEEDKEIVKFFGDICALLYHIDILTKEIKDLRKVEKDFRKLQEELQRLSKAKEVIFNQLERGGGNV